MNSIASYYLNFFNKEEGTKYIQFNEKTSMEIVKAIESDPYFLMLIQAEEAEKKEYLDGFHLTINGYKNKLFKDQIIDETDTSGSILTGDYENSLYELISRLNMYSLPFKYSDKDINDIYESTTDEIICPTFDVYVNLPYPVCIDKLSNEKIADMITKIKTNIEQGVEAMISGIKVLTHVSRYSELDLSKKQDNLLNLLNIKTAFWED